MLENLAVLGQTPSPPDVSVQCKIWPRLECSTLCIGQKRTQALSWLQSTSGMSLLRLCATHLHPSLRFVTLLLHTCREPEVVCVP